MQLTAGAVVFVSIYLHIDRLDHESAVSQMGSIAATMQMVSMSGFFYELVQLAFLRCWLVMGWIAFVDTSFHVCTI